jgi:hypothetical protein
LRVLASSFFKFRNHTQDTTQSVELLWTSDRPVAETSTWQTHNTHNKQTSMPPAGFEPAMPPVRAADSKLKQTGSDLLINIRFSNFHRHDKACPWIQLYSGGVGFESQRTHRLLCLIFFAYSSAQATEETRNQRGTPTSFHTLTTLLSSSHSTICGNGIALKSHVQKRSENMVATSKFWTPEWLQKEISVMKTHKYQLPQ